MFVCLQRCHITFAAVLVLLVAGALGGNYGRGGGGGGGGRGDGGGGSKGKYCFNLTTVILITPTMSSGESFQLHYFKRSS